MARSISDRLAQLDELGDELAGAAPPARPVSPLHAATLDMLTELMSLGERFSGPQTPSTLRVMMRTLSAAKPMLLDGLADVPEETIRGFVLDMRARLDAVLNAGEQSEP